MALLLHKRPSDLLGLRASERWLFEVDYQLIAKELEVDGVDSGKAEEIRKWKERQK